MDKSQKKCVKSERRKFEKICCIQIKSTIVWQREKDIEKKEMTK